MKTRLWKEFRAISIAWVAAMVLPLVLLLGNSGMDAFSSLCVFCYSCLGAMVFGHEYIHGTMPMLLSQPISRRRIWCEKMGVLAFSLGAIVLVQTMVILKSEYNRELWFPLLVAAYAFIVSPALSLVTKNTLSATLFSPILGGTVIMALLFFPRLNFVLEGSFLNCEFSFHFYWVILGVLAVATGIAGFFKYAKLECRESLKQEMSMRWLEAPLTWCVGKKTGRQAWRSSLIAKELQLHKLSFLLAFFFLLASLACVFYRWLHPNDFSMIFSDSIFITYWFVAPIIIGAVSMAEERQWGLLEWQLTMPPARGKQWMVKTAITYLTALALLVALPLAIIAGLYHPLEIPLMPLFDQRFQVLWTCLEVIALMTLAMFASSLCASTLRAVIVTCGAVMAIFFIKGLETSALAFFSWVVDYTSWSLDWYSQILFEHAFSTAGMGTVVRVLTASIVVGVFAVILALARFNYVSNDTRRPFVWIQWVVVIGGFSLLLNLVPGFDPLLR